MAIRIALTHKTAYTYDRPVNFSPHLVRLRPAPHTRTAIQSYSLKVTPDDHFINWQQDPFGNYQARFVFPKPARRLVVEVDLVAEMTVVNPFDFFIEEPADKLPFAYDAALARELSPYRETLPLGARLGGMVGEVRAAFMRPDRRTVDVLVDLNQAVQKRLRYDIRMEPGVFAPDETLEKGHGSCRDFAWLLVQLLRNLGFAARFVSGYSIQLKPDVPSLEGPSGVSEDCTDLHAWAEVYLPGAGWIGLDATSGLMAGEGHIPLACTPDPGNAAPITGSYAWAKENEADKVEEAFAYHMSVTRLAEQPRVTKPYREEEWASITQLGHAIDADLKKQDVRLTMGGEPTFVSIDDMEGAEWNTAAVGPTKRLLASDLVRRLQKQFSPGALLHFGQGKWYPGEPLPRWALSCYWRKDGQPLWADPALFADERHPGEATDATAATFVRALAERLKVTEEHATAAYEDAWYYLWRERRLPVNVDPLASKLDDPEERARLARMFEHGITKVVGYVLPVKPEWADEADLVWRSGPWFLRPDRLYLIPGDSPMGFRLPLDSLPWAAPTDRDPIGERDPLEKRGPLPDHGARRHQRMQAAAMREAVSRRPTMGSSAANVVRTAICIEPRQGNLHVFMPPLWALEEYLDLVSAVEDTARQLHLPVVIEGYHPPADDRVTKIQVTPDPGVIEVNIHPAHSWDELCHNTTVLYEEARQTRLGTEKFMVDGRHTGTGGGNHIVLGGATPADSPLLRRPDLLRSMASYWLNHPSLSYLFSGLFVGPTSQAPRADEARHDTVHELEIAFERLTKGETRQPWLVDRALRNLFVDGTGNTHRTELCIDKLYSPDSAAGRQGLLEMRAFEMPPHARMSLTQQLLLRGLVAWFWRAPYEQRIVRWGTGLLDRFSLPHFVKQDFGDVLADLRHAGYGFDDEWFRTHFEFRFPVIGTLAAAGIDLELRTAIEPWHVLGEEPTGGGTARYVDSSLERLQVRARGMVDSRHVITCNGRRVPLHPTGSPGEAVAGVRYRAWQPPSCLHPTIPSHAPLLFDVLDSWSGRSVGGCMYHVAHPGGRAYDSFPTNSLEAESRRVARFFRMGHSAGARPIPREERDPEFPLTLDLRRLA